MGDPPAKRQHQDVDIARSEIWLPDGNVVLQAHDTQFRVHWGVLSLHSSVFRDIQGLPQPPEQPSVEGCPVVELSDSVEDVNNLLKALYNPSVLFFLKKAIPLSVIASHIRLGRKYEFKNILQSIVERLTYEYPTTLEEYEALPQQISPTRIVDYPGVHHDMITLARENNLLSVLPLAYYRAQVTGSAPVTVFDGIPRGDGTVATLSLTDQRACVVGRIKISQAQWDAGNTFGWVEDDVAGCQDPAACMRNKSLFIHRHVVKGTLATFAPLPLSLDSLKLCAVCTQDANTKTIAGRKRMWELLPTFFDLPPWDELKYDL
ncbi:hypothetical protein C8R44DRAFT_645397 [Mycena epipterygia]|nr:hypothetical protein C8R44DRAFT_645397 [Mycena epipterygia]